MYKTECKVVSAACHKDTEGGLKVWLHAFLASALDEGEWSASRPATLPWGKKTPESTEEEDSWALAALDIWEQAEIFCRYQESNSSPSSSY